jgi:hypothetical protein
VTIWRRTTVSLALVAAALTPSAHAAAATACTHRVTSDFNGDGHADLAIGEPYRSVAGAADAGAVRIIYGSATGLSDTHVFFDQATTGIVGAPTTGDEFSLALATGFFNGDCYADLAIGTPGEDDVTILYGSASGLTTVGDERLHGRARADGFGYALAAGDLNGDGIDDLVASAPYAGDGAGEITTMFGSATGLSTPVRWISQGTPGVPGLNEPGDLFGLSLATGDFNGDGHIDVAIGVPFEDDGSTTDAGSVTVLRGSSTGPTTTGAQLFTGVSAADHYGYSLAAGDVTGGGRDDLVVGVPGADDDRGQAVFLTGSAVGLTGGRILSQDTTGVPGSAEVGDELGVSVAVGDVNGDGRADVALGVPGEDLGKAANAGTVDVLPGTSSGPTGVGSMAWSQDAAGVGGEAETGDEFGSTLYAIGGGLAIAAQLENAGVGAVTLLPAGLTSKGSRTMGEPGMAHAGDEFGASLG